MSSQSSSTRKTGRRLTVSDGPNTDLILRSIDRVEFCVHKSILCVASPIFMDMFVVAKPINAREAVVDLPEDGNTIERLLKLIYPVDDASLGSVEEAWEVRKATRKYMMDATERRVTEILKTRYAVSDPFALYAVACRDGYEEEAKVAAIQSLRHPMVVAHMTPIDISFRAFKRLCQYRETCSKQVTELNFDWIPRDNYVFFTRNLMWGVGTCAEYGSGMYLVKGQFFPAKMWWKDYVEQARKKLKEFPHGKIVTEGALIWPALVRAANCQCCLETAYADMIEFSTLYAAEIDRLNENIAEQTAFASP